MPSTPLSRFIAPLRGVLRDRGEAASDVELWTRYVRGRDPSAFEALLRRHAAMVLRVCRRVLRNESDVEDAFQATFLVFVRKAGSIRSPETLANWLRGVAHRTALEARTATARRSAREAEALPRVEVGENPLAELWAVLEQELDRLDEHYRAAVTLGDLEGKTRKEVASQLGWSEGTVASRLVRGRSLLAKRLARRGFVGTLASAAMTAGVASADTSVRAVKKTLLLCIPKTGQEPPAAGLPPRVHTLAEGVLKSMPTSFIRIRYASAAVVFLALSAVSVGLVGANAQPPGPGDAVEKTKATPDDLSSRVADLKKQLQQMQSNVEKLEQDARRAGKEGRAVDAPLSSLFKHKVTFVTGYTEFQDGGLIEIRDVWGTRPKIEVGGQYLVTGKYKLPRGKRGKLYFYTTATEESVRRMVLDTTGKLPTPYEMRKFQYLDKDRQSKNGDGIQVEGDVVNLLTWGTSGTPTLDLQMADADKPEGEFTLVHSMTTAGWFHVVLADPDKYSNMYGNVYFGTGDNVCRKRP
jgi:RNA polymerase sigma factor (sigma-70 family)